MEGLSDFLAECATASPRYRHNLEILMAATREGSDVMARQTYPQHITASACIIDQTMTQVLMILSPKFGRWLLPGGHIDAGEMPREAALREFMEECGASAASLILPPWPHPAAINVHWVDGNQRKLEPRHMHADFQYIYVCRDSARLKCRPDRREVSQVAWKEVACLRQAYEELYLFLIKEKPNDELRSAKA